jgi:hypothetical protein
MKLTKQTMEILKNFNNINPGLYFNEGQVQKTLSINREIMAEATLQEEFPKSFGIYDLAKFLAIFSIHKNDPEIEFDDVDIIIKGYDNRSKIKYRCTEKEMIHTPPDRKIRDSEVEVNFELTQSDFQWCMKTASVLSSPNIVVESDGEKVYITTTDVKDDSCNSNTLEVGEGNGDVYKMVFKTESFSKILEGDYNIEISSSGISKFINKNVPITYWVVMETGSEYQSA